MITRWSDGIYGEADKGCFEVWLFRQNTAIAYTDGNEVVLTRDYISTDKKAVQEFAGEYSCTVEW